MEAAESLKRPFMPTRPPNDDRDLVILPLTNDLDRSAGPAVASGTQTPHRARGAVGNIIRPRVRRLAAMKLRECGLARLDGETSNELFEVLADWNTQLEHLRQKPPVPPCP